MLEYIWDYSKQEGSFVNRKKDIEQESDNIKIIRQSEKKTKVLKVKGNKECQS